MAKQRQYGQTPGMSGGFMGDQGFADPGTPYDPYNADGGGYYSEDGSISYGPGKGGWQPWVGEPLGLDPVKPPTSDPGQTPDWPGPVIWPPTTLPTKEPPGGPTPPWPGPTEPTKTPPGGPTPPWPGPLEPPTTQPGKPSTLPGREHPTGPINNGGGIQLRQRGGSGSGSLMDLLAYLTQRGGR